MACSACVKHKEICFAVYGRSMAPQHKGLPARFGGMSTSCSAVVTNHTQAQGLQSAAAPKGALYLIGCFLYPQMQGTPIQVECLWRESQQPEDTAIDPCNMRMQETVQMLLWRQPCTMYLCLQGVEVGEGVHGLVGGVVQGRQGEGVQVQQLSVGRVPLWQD